MRLYLHSARCPVALRSFLDCNPNYGCFIPISWHDAADEDLTHFRSRRTLSSSSSNKTAATAASDLELSNIVAMGTNENQRVARYLKHVPLSPAAYMFSYQHNDRNNVYFSNDSCLHHFNNNSILWWICIESRLLLFVSRDKLYILVFSHSMSIQCLMIIRLSCDTS